MSDEKQNLVEVLEKLFGHLYDIGDKSGIKKMNIKVGLDVESVEVGKVTVEAKVATDEKKLEIRLKPREQGVKEATEDDK